VQLLAAAALLYLNGRRERKGRWTVLALAFLLVSADEVAGLHEKYVVQLRAVFGVEGPSPLHFAWVVPGAAFVAIVAAVAFPLLRALPATTRRRCVVAALCYVGGALGLEVLTGWLVSSPGTLDLLAHDALMTIEETLELVGSALFVHALARHLARDGEGITIGWGDAPH
jgi:hypothetical protein